VVVYDRDIKQRERRGQASVKRENVLQESLG
jgi:hypothetical protein